MPAICYNILENKIKIFNDEFITSYEKLDTSVKKNYKSFNV